MLKVLTAAKHPSRSSTFLCIALFIFGAEFGHAQESLRAKIASIAKDARGIVSVSCSLPGTSLNCDLNAHRRVPMQSVYKLPLALTALDRAERGTLLPGRQPHEPLKLVLSRKIRFLPADIIPGSFSPLAVKFPSANVDVSFEEILTLAVGQSDNSAEQILVRLVGGPGAVQRYVRSLGMRRIQVRYSERDLDRDPNLQYADWIEPTAAVQLLTKLAADSPLSADPTAFILAIMAGSQTGLHRLRAGSPSGVSLAHKTGSSGTHGGLTAATNDIGLVTLPDGAPTSACRLCY